MIPRPGHSTFFSPALPAALVILAALLAAGTAAADGTNGFVEIDYSSSTTKTTDSAGATTKLNSSEFDQKYYLTLNKTFFPHLKLDAGGIFERDFSSAGSESFESKSSDTKTNFFSNLTLNNPIYNAGLGYNRREETVKTAGSAPSSLINEDYNAVLGWRPDGLPALDLRLTRTNNRDAVRKTQDLTTDAALFTVKYHPVRQLDLRYSLTYTNPVDHLNNTDTRDMLQTARAVYSDFFFARRTSAYLSYNYSNRQTTVTTSGAGEVSVQVFPQAGLSLVEAFPNDPLHDTLVSNFALIDGNKDVGAGIDIGFSPSNAGDTNDRDMGLDFANNTTEMDSLFLWVDKKLTPVVSSSFSWDVFISDDNATWTHWAAVAPAPFGTFDKRFEISFPAVKTRFIKVVTKPLAVGVTTSPEFADINVTELQAFMVSPASEAVGKTASASHIINASAKTRILSTPYLYHDISLFLTNTSPSGITTYFLTNGLSFDQRLSRVFHVNARAAREDSDQAKGHQSSYLYSASLTATPFQTLSHSLTYSGRTDRKPTGASNTNSLTLFNKAEFYRGINAILSIGYNFATLETGRKTSGSLLNFGATFIPHRTLTLNVSYIYSTTSQSGGGKAATTSTNDRVEAGVSYNPVRALYIFASVSRTATTIQTKTLANYGVNFSPFPDGDLQLGFSYTERLGAGNEGTNRLITSSLRWNIRGGAYLDVSYVVSKTLSPVQKSDSKFLSASLKVTI